MFVVNGISCLLNICSCLIFHAFSSLEIVSKNSFEELVFLIKLVTKNNFAVTILSKVW